MLSLFAFDLLLLVLLRSDRSQIAGVEVSALALGVAFAFAEWRVIHVQFRAEASSFSLLEIPLVLGLLYSSPAHLVVATICGAAAGLLAGRRQPALKVAFNAANLGMFAGIAALFLGVVPIGGSERLIWLWTAAAVIIGSVANFGMIVLAVTLTEGFPGWRRCTRLLSFGLVVSVTNTAIGLTAGIMFARDVYALVLLVLPAVLLFVAFRMINSEREQRERIEFLYRSTRRLDVGASEEGLVTLLQEAREMFRAEIGAVVLTEDDRVRIVRSTLSGEVSTSAASAQETATVTSTLSALDEPVLISRGDSGVVANLVADVGGRDAMVAKLRAEHRDLGLLVVANRLGEVTSFSENDLQVLGALARQSAILMHSDRLEQAMIELRQLERELAYQASHDSLTGLPNRSMFTEALHLAVNSSRNHALLFIDLDGFKAVNDGYGHASGDAVLVEVGRRLNELVRPGDTVSRFGGDEFAVLLSDIDRPEVIADRIVAALAKPMTMPNGEATIGCSIGLVTGTADRDPESLLRHADAAMYRAKQSGKGTVVQHVPEQSEQPPAQAGSLPSAIRRDELELQYQPIIDVAQRRVCAVEALVRWRHPDRGLLLAGEFLGEARRAGLMGRLDRWVLTRAADEMAGIWALDPDLSLSVNLAPQHLYDGSVGALLAPSSLDEVRGRLMVEWPEEVLIEHFDRAVSALAAIRDAGAISAVDRFGDGRASLGYLQRLEVDVVKLGRRMADQLGASSENTPLVRGVVDIAHALGMRVVADGIERPEQLSALQTTACDMAQGFLFARPMAVEELHSLVTKITSPTTPTPNATTNRLG